MPETRSRTAIAPASSAAPSSAATSRTAGTCPCGRAEFYRCCYPVALRLRGGQGGRRLPASPFDEIRASAALMLWGLIAGAEAGTSPDTGDVRVGLSSAARRFWGMVAGEPSLAGAAPPDSGSAYGAALFERTWHSLDEGTRTWLLETLPPGLRYDAVVGELALDWLLWDAPWLGGEPAAAWFLRTHGVTSGQRVRDVIRSLLRSRPGLYRLENPPGPDLPGPADDPTGDIPRNRGDGPAAHPSLLLDDLLGGASIRVHTPTPPWPDPERCLLVRTYRFGSWRLAAGEGLLLSSDTVTALLDRLERDRHRQDVPGWPDPRRERWLAGRLLPLAATVWTAARNSPPLVPSPDGRYDVLLG